MQFALTMHTTSNATRSRVERARSVCAAPRKPRRKSLRARTLTLLCCALLFGCATKSQRSQPQFAAASSERASAVPAAHAPAFASPPAQFELLAARARALAAQPAAAETLPKLPDSLLALDWNGYRHIEFAGERSLWHGERFSAQFFHLGYLYRAPVHVFTIAGDRVAPYAFSPQLFRYGAVAPPAPDASLGFAGMRIHTALNGATSEDELIVFQGASYFRPLARGLAFGLSGRGLAIGTGEPGPEEFPRFSELYLVHPAAADDHVTILALLESPHATGAYAFRVTPAAGASTSWVDVTAQLFVREPVKVLGLAPLTSMYLFGKDEPARFGDTRPEVHDSDALVMHAGTGERIVRPLMNPPRTKVSSFRLDSPRGFGLVQRERRFEAYEDLVERYQDRPSAYIEPQGDWGKGVVRMQEMATPLETDDNIAVMWVPDSVPAEGLRIAYRMHVAPDMPGVEGFGHAVATRLTRTDPVRARFSVDFTLPEPPPGALQVDVTTSEGKVLATSALPNPFVRGVRASFELERPDATRDVELRAYLRAGERVLSETWSYRWPGKN